MEPILFDGQEIPVVPDTFQCMIFDLDAEEGTGRTADGQGYRARIAVKRQLEMSWRMLTWQQISRLLRLMRSEYFSVTYPDTMTGKMETKTFSVGNRPAPFAVTMGGVTYWAGLKVTLTER